MICINGWFFHDLFQQPRACVVHNNHDSLVYALNSETERHCHHQRSGQAITHFSGGIHVRTVSSNFNNNDGNSWAMQWDRVSWFVCHNWCTLDLQSLLYQTCNACSEEISQNVAYTKYSQCERGTAVQAILWVRPSSWRHHMPEWSLSLQPCSHIHATNASYLVKGPHEWHWHSTGRRLPFF